MLSRPAAWARRLRISTRRSRFPAECNLFIFTEDTVSIYRLRNYHPPQQPPFFIPQHVPPGMFPHLGGYPMNQLNAYMSESPSLPGIQLAALVNQGMNPNMMSPPMQMGASPGGPSPQQAQHLQQLQHLQQMHQMQQMPHMPPMPQMQTQGQQVRPPHLGQPMHPPIRPEARFGNGGMPPRPDMRPGPVGQILRPELAQPPQLRPPAQYNDMERMVPPPPPPKLPPPPPRYILVSFKLLGVCLDHWI